jgi:hypothetical protein
LDIGVKMARSLTDSEPEEIKQDPELREIASMLFALLRCVQEINDKLPAKPKESPLNGL